MTRHGLYLVLAVAALSLGAAVAFFLTRPADPSPVMTISSPAPWLAPVATAEPEQLAQRRDRSSGRTVVRTRSGQTALVPPGTRPGAVVSLVLAHAHAAGDTITVAVERDPGQVYADTAVARSVLVTPSKLPATRWRFVAGISWAVVTSNVTTNVTTVSPLAGVALELHRLPLRPAVAAMIDRTGPTVAVLIEPIEPVPRLRVGAAAGPPWGDLGGAWSGRLVATYDL